MTTSNAVAIFYSAAHAETAAPGVVLLAGAKQPTLWNETSVNSWYDSEPPADPAEADAKLHSRFADGIEIFRGPQATYKMLLTNSAQITEDGAAYCRDHGIRATAENLRKAAQAPAALAIAS